MRSAAAAREQALAAARGGDRDRAARLFAAATDAFASDAGLLNSAGNFHAGGGEPVLALDYFDRALRIDPRHGEAGINRAVVLTRLGRSREAIAFLEGSQHRWRDLPRYWTTKAAAEIEAGDKTAAAISYDRSLQREPLQARALAGRAQMALDRGERDQVERFNRALAAQPGDPHLLLGCANALEAEGHRSEALAITAALATQLPGWLPGMERHAELRLASGDGDAFCAHYDGAASASRDPSFFLSWASMLAGTGRFDAAAAVAARGRARFVDDDDLALAMAAHLDAVGDHVGAGVVFSHARRPTPAWQVNEARHRLRGADPAAADDLLHRALAIDPDNVVAWSLRDIAWRLLADPRHDWLSGQDGLVAMLALDVGEQEIRSATTALNAMHDRASTPIGQSVRRGSQTRGALFDLADPAVATMAKAITATLARYKDGLPAADPVHPLLRHRDTPWRFAGSWSVRMIGAGRHAAHVHPQGIVSSAAYLVTPEPTQDDPQAGWLEIGRPPGELAVLPPIATLQPSVGHVALFPSTLFHGTRPIASGRRMTIAFDVAAL